MPIMIDRICELCKKIFQADQYVVIKKNGGKFCSRHCQVQSRSNSIKRHCINCQQEFKVFACNTKNGAGVYCSIKCWSIHNSSILSCLTCNKKFKRPNSEIKKGGGKYCSKKCMDFGKSEIKNCIRCNKEFKTYKSNIKRGNGRFCSLSCSGKSTYKNKSCFQTLTPQERFFKNISNENHPDNCWIWIGLKNKFGYGRIRMNYSDHTAHRYSYELHKEQIKNYLLVCHTCDRPMCVNPDHLYLGTHQDNAVDRKTRNRNNPRRGSNHSNAKLNEQIVKEIKNNLFKYMSVSEIAKKYNVKYETILAIKTGKNWKHVL